MRTTIRCSDDAKQCVVIAVLEKNGELRSLSGLPAFRIRESCEGYYARCLQGPLVRAVSWMWGKVTGHQNG